MIFSTQGERDATLAEVREDTAPLRMPPRPKSVVALAVPPPVSPTAAVQMANEDMDRARRLQLYRQQLAQEDDLAESDTDAVVKQTLRGNPGAVAEDTAQDSKLLEATTTKETATKETAAKETAAKETAAKSAPTKKKKETAKQKTSATAKPKLADRSLAEAPKTEEQSTSTKAITNTAPEAPPETKPKGASSVSQPEQAKRAAEDIKAALRRTKAALSQEKAAVATYKKWKEKIQAFKEKAQMHTAAVTKEHNADLKGGIDALTREEIANQQRRLRDAQQKMRKLKQATAQKLEAAAAAKKAAHNALARAAETVPETSETATSQTGLPDTASAK